MSTPTRPSEELLAAPLPALIRDLGLAVAEANARMSEGETDVVYRIPNAEIEVNVAISVSKTQETEVGASLGLHAFSVNASYKSTFGFKEEASSRIKVQIQALPKEA